METTPALEQVHRIVSTDEGCLSKHALREKENFTKPVYKMPPELLGHIFAYLSGVYPAPDSLELSRRSSSKDGPHALGWIAVTHVSRRWREVALAWPGLWANIEPQLGWRWVEVMTARAKHNEICYVRRRRTSPQEVRGIVTSLSRIQVLELAEGCLDWEVSPFKIFELLAERPAPRLTRLALKTSACVRKPQAVAARLPMDAVPNLREVELKMRPVPWQSSIFKNLVQLKISSPKCVCDLHDIESMPVTQMDIMMPSLERFLDILRDCASTLEVFDIDIRPLVFSSIKDDDAFDNLPPIHLPHVKSFSFACLGWDFLTLFDKIVLPRDADIRVVFCNVSDDYFQDAGIDMDVLNQDGSGYDCIIPFFILHCADKPADTLSIKCAETFSIQTSRTTDISEGEGTSESAGSLQMVVYGPKPNRLAHLLDRFIHLVPLEGITHLDFDILQFPPVDWAHFDGFLGLPDVRTLRVVDPACINELERLMTWRGFATPSKVPFPHLERIIIGDSGRCLPARWQERGMMALTWLLDHRVMVGKPLQEIAFFDHTGKTVIDVTTRRP